MPKEKVAVVGLGYVGLPMACLMADNGFQTIGVDVDRKKLDMLRQGHLPHRRGRAWPGGPGGQGGQGGHSAAHR